LEAARRATPVLAAARFACRDKFESCRRALQKRAEFDKTRNNSSQFMESADARNYSQIQPIAGLCRWSRLADPLAADWPVHILTVNSCRRSAVKTFRIFAVIIGPSASSC